LLRDGSPANGLCGYSSVDAGKVRFRQMPENDKILVDRYFSELLNDGDFARAHEILAPGFLFYGPSTRDGLDSEGFMRFVAETRAAFSNKHFAELDRIVDGNRVALRFRMTGMQDGSFHGIPPMGGMINVEGFDLIYINQGKITEVHAYFDLMTVVQQILTPAPVRMFGEIIGRFWPR
jgi:steroid delta-isomerase-like uncharacterized protein